jgi:hypothetical protein
LSQALVGIIAPHPNLKVLNPKTLFLILKTNNTSPTVPQRKRLREMETLAIQEIRSQQAPLTSISRLIASHSPLYCPFRNGQI